ncbi:MAG: type VII toxin-antitoxin system HepT family RNase toxin [Thermodesulfobacteriota bacterium]
MKKEDVQSKLDIIPENLEKLEILRNKDFEEFASDFRNVDSALHRLQTSIQALVDIGGYIIASLGLRTPSTSTEVIGVLVEHGLLNKERQDRYISMIQFRNRIVHFYNNIDLKILYQILQEELVDIRELYRSFILIIDQHPD